MSGGRIVAIALATLTAWPGACTPATGSGIVKPPTLITQKDFGKEIKVKSGDLIEVRLPMLLPLSWVIEEDQALLTPLKGFPKSESAPADPDLSVPKLGAGQVWIHRYTISSSREITVPVTWVHCRKGNLALTKERLDKKIIPKPPDFRPDLKRSELREGMSFKVRFQIQP
jgi:hypothetical protein